MSRLSVVLEVLCVLLVAVGPASARTTVTEYAYNDDGALTEVTTTVDEEVGRRTYLVWDNFVPDENDATVGTVRLGTGSLMGIGPTTSQVDFTDAFSFDPRDRLLAYSGAAASESYDYHAHGSMSASATVDDTLRFYYDVGNHAQALRLRQDGAGLWSGYLGDVRYLSDGGEQVLLAPRKDMAGLYTPAEEQLQSYAYDAFGTEPHGPPEGIYDLRDNPFRYAREYRDPIWGGYYLRARWYHPELPSFISRDPVPTLNRYAYAGGNPIMRTDPSGMSYMSGFGRPLGRFLGKLNKGAGGDFARRIFLSPLLGPLQLLADPPGFWDAVKHNRGQIDVFLALGIVSELAGGYLDLAYAGYGVSMARRFALRTASDAVIGVGQTVAQGASRGFHHFDWNTLRQGLELTAGATLFRSYTGFNVHSGLRLKGDTVVDLLKGLDNEPGETALVFRMRTSAATSNEGFRASLVPRGKPFQEALHIGKFHERLIAVTKDEVFLNDAIEDGVRLARLPNPGYGTLIDQIRNQFGQEARFELVGQVKDSRADNFFVNPRSRPVIQQANLIGRERLPAPQNPTDYNPVINNCQHHAYSVLKSMGLR